MPTLRPDDWREGWTNGQHLAVWLFNAAWILLVLAVWILESLFVKGE